MRSATNPWVAITGVLSVSRSEQPESVQAGRGPPRGRGVVGICEGGSRVRALYRVVANPWANLDGSFAPR